MADAEAKLKHLEFVQGVIDRMATNSFVFKGWAITIAAGLSAFAANDSKSGLVLIAMASTGLFWVGDATYLYFERCFRDLFNSVVEGGQVAEFSMDIKPYRSGWRWVRTFFSWLLIMFYGLIAVVEVIAIVAIESKPGGH